MEPSKSFTHITLNPRDEHQNVVFAYYNDVKNDDVETIPFQKSVLAETNEVIMPNTMARLELHAVLKLFVKNRFSFKKGFTALWGCCLGIVKLVHYFQLKIQRWYSRQWDSAETGTVKAPLSFRICTRGLTIRLKPPRFLMSRVSLLLDLFIKLMMIITVPGIRHHWRGLHVSTGISTSTN